MKIRGNELFKCVLLMALIQTNSCDPVVDDTDYETGELVEKDICLKPGHDEYSNAMKIGNECIESGASLFGLATSQPNQTIEMYRDFFDSFCKNHTLVRRCLAERTSELESCDHANQVKVFMIYRGVLERILAVECDDGAQGQRLATLYHDLVRLSKTSSFVEFERCISRTGAIVKKFLRTSNDTATNVFVIHKEISAFKKCIHGTEMSSELREALVFFLNEVITSMKCIHPQDGTFVRCVTIDSSLIDACIVRVRTHTFTPYDGLEFQEADCFDFLLTRDNWNKTVTESREKLRPDTKLLCRVANESRECTGLKDSFNEMCLDDAQQHELELLVEFSKEAFRAVCFDDVDRMVDIMFVVYQLKNEGRGHVVWDCMDVAKSTRNVSDSTAKNMRLYREMDAAKTCLVNKLEGDRVTIDNVTFLIDKLLRMVKCVRPEDGVTVPCETLIVRN